MCFNPTLVRLALNRIDQAAAAIAPFQSHVGSISTRARYHASKAGTGFNPTLVRLARARRRGAILRASGFNPTLVRLAPTDVR